MDGLWKYSYLEDALPNHIRLQSKKCKGEDDLTACEKLAQYFQSFPENQQQRDFAKHIYKYNCNRGKISSCLSYADEIELSKEFTLFSKNNEKETVLKKACEEGEGMGCFRLSLLYNDDKNKKEESDSYLNTGREMLQNKCDTLEGAEQGKSCWKLSKILNWIATNKSVDTASINQSIKDCGDKVEDSFYDGCEGGDKTACQLLGQYYEELDNLHQLDDVNKPISKMSFDELASKPYSHAYYRGCELGDYDSCNILGYLFHKSFQFSDKINDTMEDPDLSRDFKLDFSKKIRWTLYFYYRACKLDSRSCGKIAKLYSHLGEPEKSLFYANVACENGDLISCSDVIAAKKKKIAEKK